MSRGPGRWQRTILDLLAQAGHYDYVVVSRAVVDQTLGRSMTAAEYRALNRAAWTLAERGACHLAKLPALDSMDRANAALAAWTCAKCSYAEAGEHIPPLPCFWCQEATTRRAHNGRTPDCGCSVQPRSERQTR